jgi:Zn-dependent protease with chaperone function
MTITESHLQPDTPETREYNRHRRWLELGDLVLSFGFLIALLATGWTNTIHTWSKNIGGDRYVLKLFIYVLILSVFSKLIRFGFDLFRFRLEHRFHLSNQRLLSWLKDEFNSWLLGLLVTIVLTEIIYATIRAWPPYWWLLAWLLFVPLIIFFSHIAPIVLSPLSYRYVPLQNEELKFRLTRLGERAGTRVRGVYEWKLSEKSKKANVKLVGIGSTRRIMLADTLLQNYSNDEIEAVLAHELGHHAHGHMLKIIMAQALITLAGFWAADYVLRWAIYEQNTFRFLNFQSLSDFANLPLLALVASGLSLLLMPALNAYSRFTERQADLYCWKCMANVTPYITAMEKLARQNLSESHPSRLVELLFHSHPPISKRIAAAEAWARDHRPSLAT